MSTDNHISKNKFYSVLEKRMHEYEEAIFGNRMLQGMELQMLQASLYNLEQLKRIDSQINLFGPGFWGYGITSISDAKETYSHHDVEEIKKIVGLNKHLEDYRILLLLIFKIENDAIYFSFFSMDTCTVKFNSNINTKFDLNDFDNAALRFRGNSIFIDLAFKKVEKQISFQIETYMIGEYLSRLELAKYYTNRITELANEVKNRNRLSADKDSQASDLNKKIDQVEIKLRNFIVDILCTETGKEDFQTLLTGDAKSQVKRRIAQHVAKHPNMNEIDFKLLKDAIQFCDIEHLKKTILKPEYWPYFESKIKDKFKVEKYLDQLSDVRHVVKHTRDMTDFVLFEGKAAVEWLEMVLS